MATNIAKISGVVSVTEGTKEPKYFFGQRGYYYFNSAETIVNVQIGDLPGVNEYVINFSDLQVNGASPSTVAIAKIWLNSVFAS